MSFGTAKSSVGANALRPNEGSVARDMAVTSDATDTISSLRWSPVSNHLAASSWDGKVRIYDVATDLTTRGVALIAAEAPVLSCDWSEDGTIITGAGADKKVHLLHAATGQTFSFAAHEQPIRAVRFLKVSSAPSPLIATGSWDKTVRYWDPRNTGSPLATLNCDERVHAMDVAGNFLVIGMPQKAIHIVDLKSPNKFRSTTTSALNHQTRVISAIPDGSGYATGSIGGQAGFKYFSDKDSKENFTFRCHREPPKSSKGIVNVDIWAVNDINNHPVEKTVFSTAGSDGSFCFWDRVQRLRIRSFPKQDGAITATCFSRDGKVFAYAIGYDWSMGYAKNSPTYPLRLMLHPMSREEVAGKKKF